MLLLVVLTVGLSLFFTVDDIEEIFLRDNATEKVTQKDPAILNDEGTSELEPVEVHFEKEPFSPRKVDYFQEPEHLPKQQVVRHYAYSLQYNEYYEQASWVAYRLSAKHLLGTHKRTDHFTPDPKVNSKSASDKDYRRSGYDRGHLAPAADMKGSKTVMEQCFYMSNISPQKSEFNGGVWLELEEQVRNWVKKEHELYIVTGPVLPYGLKRFGKNQVGIPRHFYKVVLDIDEPKYKAIAFLMKNRGTSKNIRSFAVTVDSVEKFTGLNFFPALPDSLEHALESKINLKAWKF